MGFPILRAAKPFDPTLPHPPLDVRNWTFSRFSMYARWVFVGSSVDVRWTLGGLSMFDCRSEACWGTPYGNGPLGGGPSNPLTPGRVQWSGPGGCPQQSRGQRARPQQSRGLRARPPGMFDVRVGFSLDPRCMFVGFSMIFDWSCEHKAVWAPHPPLPLLLHEFGVAEGGVPKFKPNGGWGWGWWLRVWLVAGGVAGDAEVCPPTPHPPSSSLSVAAFVVASCSNCSHPAATLQPPCSLPCSLAAASLQQAQPASLALAGLR